MSRHPSPIGDGKKEDVDQQREKTCLESKSLPLDQERGFQEERKVEGKKKYIVSILQLLLGFVAISYLLPRQSRSMPNGAPVEKMQERVQERAPRPRTSREEGELTIKLGREFIEKLEKIAPQTRPSREEGELTIGLGRELIEKLEKIEPQTEEDKTRVTSFLEKRYVYKGSNQLFSELITKVSSTPEDKAMAASLVEKLQKLKVNEAPERSASYREILEGAEIRRFPTRTLPLKMFDQVFIEGKDLLLSIALKGINFK